MSIHFHGVANPHRRRVEAYAEATYERAFEGHIRGHYPNMMSLEGQDGTIHATVGFRIADQGPLYLEYYLDAPIEQAVGQSLGTHVQRRQIAEIGNLASNRPGASLFLFMALAKHLDQQACTHAVATATRQLRRTFRRLDFDTQLLAPAMASRLGDDALDWGGYYSRDPEVLFGAIAPALPRLGRILIGNTGNEACKLDRFEGAMQ